jgi:hypothetical protein
VSKSMWGIFVITLGATSIFFIALFQNLTNTDEHNSQLLKETAEAAMWDAVDYAYYTSTGVYKINKEKFVENFLRRFAENASKSRTYNVEFYDVNEVPPKVSIKVTSKVSGQGKTADFTLSNKIDAILETPY